MSATRLLNVLLLILAVAASSAFSPSAFLGRRSATALWGSSRGTTIMAATERDVVRMAAVLDRTETVKRTTKKTNEPVKERRQQGNEAWEVRIYNDGLNTREHVARSLVQVTGISEVDAYQTMMHAHQNGIAVVGRFVFELAEMYDEQLKNNGIVSDIVPVDEEK